MSNPIGISFLAWYKRLMCIVLFAKGRVLTDMSYVFIFFLIITLYFRDLFNLTKAMFSTSHILCAMLISIKKYSMHSLFIIARVLYLFSRIQSTMIDVSSKRLSSNLQVSIFIIFISFIFAAIVAKISLFSTRHFREYSSLFF